MELLTTLTMVGPREWGKKSLIGVILKEKKES
jgi:hypothetical protein